jgi:hypothetical protein
MLIGARATYPDQIDCRPIFVTRSSSRIRGGEMNTDSGCSVFFDFLLHDRHLLFIPYNPGSDQRHNKSSEQLHLEFGTVFRKRDRVLHNPSKTQGEQPTTTKSIKERGSAKAAGQAPRVAPSILMYIGQSSAPLQGACVCRGVACGLSGPPGKSLMPVPTAYRCPSPLALLGKSPPRPCWKCGSLTLNAGYEEEREAIYLRATRRSAASPPCARLRPIRGTLHPPSPGLLCAFIEYC